MIVKIPTPYRNLRFKVREDSLSDKPVLKEIFEENVYHVHDSMITDSKVVLDIGANIGAFTIDMLLRAKNNGKPITVYAVEAEPHNVEVLKQTLIDNEWVVWSSKVVICEKAIGAKRGIAKISDSHGDSKLGDSGSEVEIITLDDLFDEYGITSVDFAKFDIEGSEIPALLAASDKTIDAIHHTAIEFDEDNGLDKFSEVINRFARKCSISTLGVPSRGCYIYTERHIK